MTHRVHAERRRDLVAYDMSFVALRWDTGGVLASATDSVDLARLMIAWTQLDRDAGLVSTFATSGAASSWLSASPPPLPLWAARTCVVAEDTAVVIVNEVTDSSPVFGLLREAGGQLAAEKNSSLIPRLINTVKALNGEIAVVRMLSSVAEAEQWLLSPSLPSWLLAPDTVPSTAWVSKKDEVAVVAVETADGVINLCDDDTIEEDAEQAARVEFRRVAQALPPPPPLKRTILSLASIRDSMTLPVVFQRNPATGRVVRTDRMGRSSSRSSLSSATGASLLTPPSPAPSRSSVASETPLITGRRAPVRGSTPHSGPSQSVTTGASPPPGLLASLKSASELRSTTSRRWSASRGMHESGSRSRTPAGGELLSKRPSPPPQTCTPLPTPPPPHGGPPTKKLRRAEAVPFHLGRLAKSILGRKSGLFVTGGGGVGKTRVLRQCADEYRDARSGSRAGLHVVAPTGVAAAAAGGVTIHSYLRLAAGCFDESLSEEDDAARLFSCMDGLTKRRLADTSVLLLDEVSMVSSRMFTMLVYSIEMAHTQVSDYLPWRLVAFGDFFQLPPVRGDEDHYDSSGQYAFKSVYWRRLFRNEQLQLRYVWRQEDKKLIGMLSRLRVGDLSSDLDNFLRSRSAVYQARVEAGVVMDMGVTRIFPHRHRVKAHNADCLASMEKLNGCARVVYTAIDYPIGVSMTEDQVTAQLDASVLAPKKLEVCVGARVAACATVGDGQVEVPNGTVGTVIGYQGSSAHSLNVQATRVPVVRFDTVRGPVVMTVKQVDMKLQSVSRDGAYASRYQVPLVLAWAVTVHRCQGLSMDAAVLDLASCFLDGMVYVALSRVRFMEGVHILSFASNRVRADQRVALFYEKQRDVENEFSSCVDTMR